MSDSNQAMPSDSIASRFMRGGFGQVKNEKWKIFSRDGITRSFQILEERKIKTSVSVSVSGVGAGVRCWCVP